MPIARFELPDGRIGRFEVPEGTTPEQAVQLISSSLPDLLPKETAAPIAPPVAAPAAVPATQKPWWAPFSETATGETELGKELGPKVLGGSLAQDIVAAAKSTPAYAKAAVQSIAGGNKPEDLTSKTGWENDAIAEARKLSKQNAKDPALQEEYILGITRQKVQELPQNAMFSVLSMGAGLAAAAPGFLAGGPVGAYAAGTAASGLAAYRMDTNGFLRDIREHLDEGSIKATGKPLTDKQWLDYAKSYNSLVQEHGLWEAVPEAIGNAVGAKLGGMIFKEAGKGLMGTLKSFGASALEFGNELGTETVTQTGQHNVEVDAGLSDQPKRSFTNPSDIAKSAKEVLPDVLLLTGAMTGSAHIAGKVYDNTKFGQNKQIADAIKEEVKGKNFSPERIRKEAIARLNPNSYNQELIEPEETSYTGKKLAGVAPPEPPEEQVPPERKIVAPSESQDTQGMMDELLGIKPPEPAEVPTVSPESTEGASHVLPPKVEVTHVYPMGENTEYQVLKTPTGYVANLFDKDAGKYVLGSARGYPIRIFGTDSEVKANEFAQEQMRKAAKFNPLEPAAPTEQAPEQVAPTAPIEAPKAEEPKKEAPVPTPLSTEIDPQERLRRANVAIFNAKRMLSNGQITQAQYDDLQNQYTSIKAKSSQIGKNAKTIAPVVATKGEYKETKSLETFFANHKDDKNRLDTIDKYGQPEVKQVVANINTALQQVTDAINAAGYSSGERKHQVPAELRPLFDQYSQLTGGASRLLMESERVGNNKKLASQEKLAKAIEGSKADVENAYKILGVQPETKTVTAPKVEPKIKVSESAVTPTPILNKISSAAVDAINAANDYSQKLTEGLPTAKNPDAHQLAIDRLNNASEAVNDKGQIVADEMARTNKKSPGQQNRDILAAQKDLNKALIEHRKAVLAARKLVGDIKTKEPKPKIRKVRPAIEELSYPAPPEQAEVESLNKEYEKAKRRKDALEKKGGLFGALKGSLSASEVKDIGTEDKFLPLKNKDDIGDISTKVANGALDNFLEPRMRHDSPSFDEQQSVEHIKEKLRTGNYMPYETEMEIEYLTRNMEELEGNIEELEKQVREQLELKDVNLLIEEAADEQRKIDQANQVYESENEAGVSKPSKTELELRGETPEEVRAKEKEKEDRAKAEKEAEAKAKADEGVAEFTLTGSNRPADVAAAKGQVDLFGEPIKEKTKKEPNKEPEPSPAYMRALDESRQASRDFMQAQTAYRANEISDEEFLNARKEYDLAISKFDKVFEAESKGIPMDDPNIIDGADLIREIGKEKQLELIANESKNLTERETAVLEEEYGSKSNTDEFLQRLHDDVSNFITKGANSVKNKIRGIINKIANSLLSVAVAFNVGYVSPPVNVVVPAYETKTQEVIQEAPEEAAKDMSPQARRAYEVLYPSLKNELIKENKLFLVTDKPTAMQFIFNPDGSLLLKSKVLLAKGVGDFERGNNNIDANKITPAGVRTLVKRFHTTSTEGYDFDTVFGTMGVDEKTGGRYFSTVYHSVYTHLPDAQKRLQALQEPGGANSRYSFGCINVDKVTFGKLVKEHGEQMDGATLFVVPDNDQNVMNFINGQATTASDILRRKVEPTTQEVQVPVRGAKAVEGEKLAAREEQFYSIEPFSEEKKRDPSFKRAVTELNKGRNKGMLTDEEFAIRIGAELEADNNRKANKPVKPRERGQDIIIEKLRAAKRKGEISGDAVELAEWFMRQNPSLVDDLGISIKQGERGVGGYYENLSRIFTLMKNAGNEETPVHEILHHTERMMPPDIQTGIQKEWIKQLVKAQKNAKTDAEKVYFAALMDGHFGDNRALNIEVKDKNGNVDKSVNKFLYDAILRAKQSGETLSSLELAKFLLQHNELPVSNYRFTNPSEFWAVNGSRIVAGDYASVNGGRLAKLKNWLGKLAEKLKSLFGLRSDAPIIRALESLSKSDGKFKTQDMLGVGEYQSINPVQGQMFPQPPQGGQQPAPAGIPQQTQMFGGLPPGKRNIFGAPATPKSWDLQPETQIGSLIDLLDYKIADKHVDTRKVQQAITKNAGAIDDAFDVYMKEELYHGRTANELKDFLQEDLSPLVGDLIKDGLTIDELEQYLHNRHAAERNDAIARINARFADVDNEPGSGIGTQAAKDYFKNLDPTKAAKLAKAAARVDKIIAETQKILVDRGLETKETIDTWNQAYKHYVPLMRDQEELDFMHHGAGLGKGFQVKGGASKRAYGSTKSVVDILANIAIQRESAIIRSEKARIGRALYGLVLQNPNADFWFAVNPDAVKNKGRLYQELIDMGLSPAVAQNFVQEPKSPSIDPLTGQVRYQINVGLRGSPNVFPVRINGKDRYIFFNTKDPKAVRMAQALSNLDAQSLGGLLGTTAIMTRWLASVNTQYNPVFGMINFARDVEGAMINLSDTPLAGKQKEVFSHVFPAVYAIYGSERFARKNKKLVTKYATLFDEFRRAGGTTGYREAFAKGSFSGKDKSIIEREWAKQTEGAAMKKARWVFDALSDYNEAMENAVRLAVFKTALDAGFSVEKAASMGKNITVNFNRKGQGTPILQALYAFFNASVRGSVLVAKTLNGPAGRKIIAGGLALGVLEALWMAMAGFDNDDPPDYVKDKNFIIPTGGGKYVMFPMPQGFNVIPGLGRIVTEYVLGKNGLISGGKPVSESATQIMTLLLDAFNPLGGGSMLQMLAPTVLDPLAAATMNKDAFGRPIYKEDMAMKQTPGFMRSRENATTVSQWISQFLNYVSSPAGTKYTKGSISPTADEIDYYAGQVGGGAAREAIKGAETVKSWFTSEPQPIHRVPVVGRFYGDINSQSAIQNKFYNNVTLMNKYANEVKNLEDSGQDPTKFFRNYPAAVLYEDVNGYYNEVNQMNAEKKEMLKAKAPIKEVRMLEQAKTQVMKEFNDQVRQAQKR